MSKAIRHLAKHSVLAMVVSVVFSMLLGMLLVGTLRAIKLDGAFDKLNFDAWYGPLVWLPGLLLGFFVNRRTLHRAACFVWLPGLAWVATGMLGKISHGYNWTQVRMDLFPLKTGECGTTECLDVLFGTYPAVSSAAYSIGAALGLLSKRDEVDRKETPPEYTTIGLD